MKKKDIILVQDIKNGDVNSQEKLYNKYKKKIHNHLSYKYINNVDIDDDVSEILIKVFDKIEQYDAERGKFSTWVVNITNNYMIDKARKNDKNPVQVRYDTTSMDGLCLYSSTCGSSGINTFGSTSTSNFQPVSFSQPDMDIENKDSLDFISRKIGIEDFHLLNLKYKDGYDYKEIESEMNVSSSTISNRVNYVKSKLKKK